MPQHATGSVKVLATRFSRWHGRSRVLAAAAGMVLAVGIFASPAAAVTTSIALKPSSGPPTSKVTVTGTGFDASETVAVGFSGIQPATATTSSTGAFSATFTVPKSALPGNHPVTATGQTSGRSATKNFLVRTNWAKFHFDPANSGLNPYENVIGQANVSGLKTAWTAPNTIGSVASSPAVYNGVVYVGTQFNGLKAYSATGGTLLWTGATQNGAQINVSSPAVANGVVYIAATDNRLYAFKATGCGGTTCQPLWTAAIGTNGNDDQSSPTVANGVVYVASGSILDAFSTTSHALLWSAPNVSDEWAPAVVNGVVYIGGATGIVAFSANGTTRCSGTPLVCKPLWVGAAGSTAISSPAVVKGVVYVGANTNLYAFSASGCGTTTCQPLRHSGLSNYVSSSPAVANGVAYVTSADGNFYAFSTSSGALLWTAAIGGSDNSSPAVANGVVYVGSHGQLYAFSANGSSGCSGTSPNKTCTPLWTGTGSGDATYSSPAVANGMVYIGQWNGGGPYFAAYKLP